MGTGKSRCYHQPAAFYCHIGDTIALDAEKEKHFIQQIKHRFSMSKHTTVFSDRGKTRCRLLMIICLPVLCCILPARPFAQGFLQASGTDIVNGKGEKIILRGMGLGGWMLQEGYMLQLGNIGQQYKIKARIEELAGKEKTEAFYRDWLLNHTRKADIDSMAAWGFNSVRLPMHYRLYTLPAEQEPVAGQQTWLEQGFALTDSLLQWCKANKIYLILDLHAAPGGQGNDLPISDRDPSKPSLWQSEANRQKTIALWRKLAERYANEPWIGGYDIINEPNWGFEDSTDVRGTAEKKNAPLKKLMMDITQAIREADPHHLIIIEGNGFGNNYNGILPAWDNNMALSFHKYGNFNTEAAISRFLALRAQYHIPLWLGESGENSNTWFTEAILLAESHGIGWSWWPLKKMGMNNPLEIKQPTAYRRMLDYWNGKGPRPSADEAAGALQELAQNIRIENNIMHKDVIDAMFRQVQSTAAIPFSPHLVNSHLTIPAVEYDLGRQGYAYYDKDSASYMYTPGVNTRGNRGHCFRNDGVDIQAATGNSVYPYYIFSIEDGEWLQYTIQVARAGRYTVRLSIAAETDSARLTLQVNETAVATGVAVPLTGGAENWQTMELKNIPLNKGTTRLRIRADKGGFHFAAISLQRN
jgi:hypothetical protein